MKNILFTIAIGLIIQMDAFAQAAYILPSPTGKNDTITLYINVAQTTDGVQNSGLNARLNAHPDDSVYLWTWAPAGPVAGNGSWNNSSEAMRLTKVSDKLYSIRFLPTDFYGVEATEFFSLGISCLAKMKDGNAYAGEYGGEAKTEDLHVTIIPRLCDDPYCAFPEIGKPDDFLSITYDNAQETNPALQNLGDDECYLFLRVEQSVFTAFNYTTPELASSTPALKMKRVGDSDLFRLTILPSDLFEGIVPVGFDMNLIKYYVLKPGFTYSSTPPYEAYTFQDCD